MFMFDNEVTYSKDELAKYFTVQHADRTALIEKALSAMSDSYAAAVEQRDALVEDRKADKDAFVKGSKVMTYETVTKKIKAANILFIRAATATFHLRHVDAYGVKLQPNGFIRFTTTNVDDKGEPIKDARGNVSSDTSTMSGSALATAGEKSLVAAKIKAGKKAPTKVNNTANSNKTAGVATIVSVINNRVKKALAATATGAVDDLTEDDTRELDNLLDTLMAAKFLDERGEVDRKVVLEYLDLAFPRKDTKANKAA